MMRETKGYWSKLIMNENVNDLDPTEPFDFAALGLLKFELLASGLRVSNPAKEHIQISKGPVRTRSGASGGLDIVLPHGIHVNAPIVERFASQSQLLLDCVSDKLIIRRGEKIEAPVRLQPTPQYYDLLTTESIPMIKIGQMCSGDRFCYGITGPYCWF